VVAIIGPGALGGLDLRSLAQGAIVLASTFYAMGSVWGKLRLSRHPPAIAAAGMLTCGALATLPAGLALEGPLPAAPAAPTAVAVLWLSAVGTAGAYLLYYRVLSRAGAANVMLVTLLIPAVAVAIGAVVLGERIGPEAAAGYALLALGLAVIDGRATAAAADAVTRLRRGRRGA
jgi:drug/metabolite transporter (DMT)-like permease